MTAKEFVMDQQLEVRVITLPDYDLSSEDFKGWKKEAARQLAEKIVEDSLMEHHSTYDIARHGEWHSFSVLVGKRKRWLP